MTHWYFPQNIDGETRKYFCKWHGHVVDDVFARITFRKRWWEIPTRAAFIAPVVVGGPVGVLMFLEAWGVDVKYRDSEMCSHTHKSHVKFLMVYFTIRVFSVCLLFLGLSLTKRVSNGCYHLLMPLQQSKCEPRDRQVFSTKALVVSTEFVVEIFEAFEVWRHDQ